MKTDQVRETNLCIFVCLQLSVKGDAASGFISSRLYVANAAPSDSGRYGCWYANYTSDTLTVHVIAGECTGV